MPPRLLQSLVLLASVVSPTALASITSLTVQDNTDGDYLTLVRQDGDELAAVNFGHSGPPVVVNGVAFQSAPGNTPSGDRWSVSGTRTSDGLDHSGVDDLFFSELASSGELLLTYQGLDPAKSYLVQFFHGEPRDCCATTYSNNSLQSDFDDPETIPPIAIGNGTAGEDPPAAGDLALVTAILSGVTEFQYTARPGAGRDSALAGFQVRELSSPPGPTGHHPFISEFVAVGNDTFEDEDEDTPDWLELYNPTAQDLDLGGYFLTDDPADLTKWRFPATLLQGANYLVVFASDKNRDTADAELHTDFRLGREGEYLALVAPDGQSVLSEFTPRFPRQEAGFSYGVGGLAPDGARGYFGTPTPGSANGLLLTAPLLAPLIDPPCGTFTATGQAIVNSNFPDAEIRYTTDGSEPTRSSPLYRLPVRMASTTHLRARVFDPDTGMSGEIASAHFQKLGSSPSGGLPAPSEFTSDLPIIIVENFGTGGIPAPGATFQTARISVHEVDPVSGRSSLASPPDACFRIGIRRRGQSSSGFAKPQYRVELRDDNDVDTDYPLLGLPEESDWVFNGPWTDKALIRNPLAFSLGRAIGIQAPRSAHFEMFLSTNGGDLTANEYVGVYVLLEKIKDDRNRTDLANLEPQHSDEPEVTGGYLMRFEPPGIANDGPRATNWTSVEIIEPQAPTSAQQRYLGRYLDQFVRVLGWRRGQGPNNSGLPNPDPEVGYPSYIDVDSFVSLFIVNELLREQDSYVRSDYMFKDRLGKLHKGPLWDYNLIAGTGCCFDNRNTSGWQYQQNYNRGGRDHSYEPDWFVPLMRCPDFRQRVIDRWAELRTEGVLDLLTLFGVIDQLADPLAEAAERNFTKWNILGNGNVGFPTPTSSNWPDQVRFMKTWLRTRLNWIDDQFPERVTFSPGSGVLEAGGQVTLSAPSGAICYTSNGTDPRLPGGEISPSALSLVGGGEVGGIDSTIIARVLDGEDWGPPTIATYTVFTPADATNLLVTELNYHPSNPTPEEVAADPTFRDDDFEFIELRNIGDSPIDLAGARFVEGISFQFPAPGLLLPGARVVLVENRAAFEARYGSDLQPTGVYANKLNNDGDTLRLVDINGNDIFHFTYNDTWHRPADGDGYSMVLVNEDEVPADYNDPAAWTVSAQLLGNPGGPNQAVLSPSFTAWKAGHFTALELADPLITGPFADLDLDGLNTLLEFALVRDPRTADSTGLLVPAALPTGNQDYLTLTFRRWKNPNGLSYRVEVSSDLVRWSETSEVVERVDHANGTETVTFRDSTPLDPDLPRFIRLVVSLL